MTPHLPKSRHWIVAGSTRNWKFTHVIHRLLFYPYYIYGFTDNRNIRPLGCAGVGCSKAITFTAQITDNMKISCNLWLKPYSRSVLSHSLSARRTCFFQGSIVCRIPPLAFRRYMHGTVRLVYVVQSVPVAVYCRTNVCPPWPICRATRRPPSTNRTRTRNS